MRWKLIDATGSRAYVVVLDPGDEAVALLSDFATDRPELGLALIDLDR